MLGAVAFNAVNIVRHLVKGDILEYFTPYFDLDNMIGFVFLAVISTIVATGMNNFALKYMQVSTMSAFGGVSTMVTVAAGVLFANETLYVFHIIGLSLIVVRMVGVSAIAIRKEKKSAENNKF
jgi:drug/metabolite transporter (DMT)-like permease